MASLFLIRRRRLVAWDRVGDLFGIPFKAVDLLAKPLARKPLLLRAARITRNIHWLSVKHYGAREGQGYEILIPRAHELTRAGANADRYDGTAGFHRKIDNARLDVTSRAPRT